MTKKLEDFFNLDDTDDIEDQEEADQLPLPLTDIVTLENTLATVKEQLSIAERIDIALPQVKGLDTDDKELDDYANKAMESYEKLMDLGFNVDDRNAGKIFEVASGMMSNAITAKTTKLEKKLKMVELQLKAAKLANDIGNDKADNEPSNDLNTDRNAILNIINQNLKNRDK
jgi:hypothetical protein